jgi:hypothetical protein
MRRHFAFVACALAIGACAVNHDSGAGPTATIPPPSTTTYEVALNTESGVVAGTQAGYGVRTLAAATTFRFIWTGDGDSGGGYHEFWGSVWTTGHFTDQVPGCTNGSCALESGDFVSAPYATTGGQRIDWDTFADDGLDGFEVTTDQVPLYVDAYIDGVRYPNLFFFPDATQNGDIASVTAIPCAFTTQQ